jgi:antirestriction protein ArdC
MSPGFSGRNAVSLHEEITNRIIEELKQGRTPWVKPWSVPLPYNAATQHRYSGINVLLLWLAPYRRPAWITFRQAGALGGRVRKGERAIPIVYVSKIMKTEGEEERMIPFLRRYHVFNVEQVEGLPSNLYAQAQEDPTNTVNLFLSGIDADVRHGCVAAYFDRTGDYIQLPDPEHFISRDRYYATRLHETVHWSGHASRLNRQFGERFGDNAYVFEELVAELGSAFLSAELGLPTELHHAEYIRSWIAILSDHRQAIFTAAAKASAAADYLADLVRERSAA